MMPRLHRLLSAAFLLLLSGIAPPASANVDPDELLPVDEAFVLSARALDRGTLQFDWTIAEGYYLYRHRTSAQATGTGFIAGELKLPTGTPYHDEFFGDVETYRQHLTATLPGQADASARSITVQVKYQGCADIGICYPPQSRNLTVALPTANIGGDTGFNALGQSLASGARTAAGIVGTPQPLPEAQAFGFEAIADGGNRILMRFTPAKGYYLYQDRNSFRLQGSEGISAGQPRWPKGTAHRDAYFGDVTVYFDQIDVPLPVHRTHAEAARLTLTATFQGCQDEGICYPPMTRTIQIALPAGAVDPVAVPAASTTGAATVAEQDPGAGSAASPAERADPATTQGSDTDEPDATVGIDTGNPERSTPPAAQRQVGVFTALLLALGGGLILNLMPCVLPILSLKVLGVAQSGESHAHARSHALWYTLGVLSAFAAIGLLVIALRAGGQALGWGFQLQQPWFVAALVYLMFAVGLSLSGVFSIGGSVGGIGQTLAGKTGPTGDFFTGVLACVVASPCIAPLMGAALAFAFASSAWLALAVFLMLGLGLALPFLLIGFVPALASRLPKPGVWMETLKQVLAFPMYLTAIWLLWVLGRQRGVDAMALVVVGLTVFTLGIWWFERKRWTGSAPARALGILIALAALLPIWQVTRIAPIPRAGIEQPGAPIAYAPERLQALRDEGRIVFVNMTADWCVTCKANERRVLSRSAFQEALAKHDAAYMVGDWTDVDATIGAFLAAHGAVGVPLYVVYPKGGGDGEVLPVILSEDIAVSALERAAR